MVHHAIPSKFLLGLGSLLLGVGAAGAAQAQYGNLLGDNVMEFPTIGSIYNYSSCFQGSSNFDPMFLCGKIKGKPIYAKRLYADYWEPAAIVEVSCRNGYSLMKPDMTGRGDKLRQSCSATGPQWFFEARVWSSSGQSVASDRGQAFGSNRLRENTMRCSADGTTGTKYIHGYGKKHNFSRGARSGPGFSFEAYLSDLDESWAKAPEAIQEPPSRECSKDSPDIEACWGDPNQQHGWVTHPNQAVAAALAGYRALMKAQGMNKVATPLKDGWKMSMDYPFIKKAGDYAESMGFEANKGGRHRGSSCFKPGDPGPKWFNVGEADALPDQMMAVATLGDKQSSASVAPGLYIFTYWVRTSCTIFDKQLLLCKDKFHY